ncbi:MAG: hypothetical protein ABR899_01665 [Candidatus Krumholzibacteriaceae bacterium]|jgi:hypothetical protein
MNKTLLIVLVLLFVPCACTAGAKRPVIFASYADNGAQLRHAAVMTESIRDFGARVKDAPVWIYGPAGLLKTNRDVVKKLVSLGAQVKASEAPGESAKVPSAGKVFTAAQAEREATGAAAVLVWMDNDTVVLKDPGDLLLAEGKSLGLRPVAYQNIGSLYAEPPDAFWSGLYRKLSVPASALFPMKTVADGKTLRPYFDAGLLVVRPERGIMKAWAESFSALCGDPDFAAMCGKSERTSTFLYEAVLAGAILNLVHQDEMVQLPEQYNYPLFFKELYGGDREFHTIDNVVTLRYDVYFDKPGPGWGAKLKGPAATISWLEKRFGGGEVQKKQETSTKMRFRFEHGGKKR